MDKNSTKYMVESSQAVKNTTASYDENYILTRAGILNIYGNCSKLELVKAISESPDNGIHQIQFARKFSVKMEYDI